MEEKGYCIDCVDYQICALSSVYVDDEPCDYFQKETTDPEEPGNDLK